MGFVCHYVFQPVIKFIQFAFSVIEFFLVQICKFITELVNVLVNILSYICNTVTQSVCGAVCGVICFWL
jgi:phage-related protein